MLLEGFEGWRHSRQLQDELLETLEAGLGADDVNLATGWAGCRTYCRICCILLAGWLATGTPGL